MNRLIMERPDGSRYTIAPGENHPADHRAIGIERNGVDESEDKATMQMLQEIEQELGAEAGTSGDWVAFFAKPIALVLDKEDCLSCEFRRVCLNCGKKLRRIYGPAEGKKKMKALIKRSFTENAQALGLELKKLLEN
jgi:hypothetical protein